MKNRVFEKNQIDMTQMLRELIAYNEELLVELQIAGSIPKDRIMSVFYEDYLESVETRSRINSDIFRFLDIDVLGILSGQKKIGIDDLSNYDEACAALSGTDYFKY